MKKTIATILALTSMSVFAECRDLYQYRVDRVKNFKPTKVVAGALTITSGGAISAAFIPYGFSAAFFAGGLLGGVVASIGAASISDQWLKKLDFQDVLKIINEAELGDGKMINEFVTRTQNVAMTYSNKLFKPSRESIIRELLEMNDEKMMCKAYEIVDGDLVNAARNLTIDITIDNFSYDLFSGPEISAVIVARLLEERK